MPKTTLSRCDQIRESLARIMDEVDKLDPIEAMHVEAQLVAFEAERAVQQDLDRKKAEEIAAARKAEEAAEIAKLGTLEREYRRQLEYHAEIAQRGGYQHYGEVPFQTICDLARKAVEAFR